MKVLHINSTFRFGSTGRIVSDMHSYLISKGHESFVIYGLKKTGTDYYSKKMTSKLGNHWHMRMSMITGKNGLYSSVETKKVIKEIKKINPDIIHIHNIHGYYINYSLLFKFLNENNIPVLWTFHDCWPFTGGCVYYSSISCRKFERECFNCELLGNYPKSKADSTKKNFMKKKNLFLTNTKMIITTPSRWLKNEVVKSFFSDFRTEVVYNGVDLSNEIESPSADTRGLGRFVVGVAHPWDERKGLSKFIELAKQLKDTKIVLVGVSKEQQVSFPKNIVGISRTDSRSKLNWYYSNAELHVSLSDQETFGLTFVEAAALGTKSIGVNKTAIPEILEMLNGQIFEEYDAKVLAQFIDNYQKVEDHTNYAELSKQFSNERMLRTFYELYIEQLNLSGCYQ